MICFGNVPAGSVLPVIFDAFAGSTGASITLTGLAVTDIEVYKGTSMTQRSSDAGYTLLDTDGIDLDGVTGIHGFSIDTGDNTDAGFYAAGSFYTVVVSSVTIDSQTVNFVAATFRLAAAESTAGTPKADVSMFGGSAGNFSSGRPEVNTTHAAGTAWGSGAITAAALAADAITAAKVATDVTTELQSGLATAAALATVDTVVDAILALLGTPAGASISADIAALPTAAEINAEVVDALTVDTYAEPSGVPAATASLEDKISWLAALARNKLTQTSTTQALRNDADSGNIATAGVSDDGVTMTRNEWA